MVLILNNDVKYIAYYLQYLSFYQQEYNTFELAKSVLTEWFDCGECFPVGIYDTEAGVLYVSTSLGGYYDNLKRIKNNTDLIPVKVERIML